MILLILKNRFTPITATHHMIECSSVFNSWLSSHTELATQKIEPTPGTYLYICTLTPILVTLTPILADTYSRHAITSDIGLGETAHAAEFMLADAVIITGGVTGDPPTIDDIKEAKKSTKLPVVHGSGVDVKNLESFWNIANGFIVGSTFKRSGNWRNPPERSRVKAFMKETARLGIKEAASLALRQIIFHFVK